MRYSLHILINRQITIKYDVRNFENGVVFWNFTLWRIVNSHRCSEEDRAPIFKVKQPKKSGLLDPEFGGTAIL